MKSIGLPLLVSCLVVSPASRLDQVRNPNGPDPSFDLRGLVDASDLVATGVVRSVSHAGATPVTMDNERVPGVVHRVDVAVERVIKGPALASASFLLREPELTSETTARLAQWYSRLWGAIPLEESRQVFFLRKDATGYAATDDRLPAVIAVTNTPRAGATAFEEVLAAIAGVMVAADQPAQSRRQALEALRYTDEPAALAALRGALKSPDEETRYRVAGVLLQKSDVGALPFAEAALLSPSVDQADPRLEFLRAGLGTGFSAADGVEALDRLLKSPDVKTRRAAAEALSRTQTPRAIPIAASLLSDADADVAYWAVVSLRDLTGQGRGLSRGTFEARRTEQLTLWTAWARARRLIK